MRDGANGSAQCVMCAYYDDDNDTCTACRDEDDVWRFLSQPQTQCCYFTMYDEYKIVRKQN